MMADEDTFKVKAFIDSLKSEDGFCIIDRIMDSIPSKYEDETWEFEVTISNIKKCKKGLDSGIEISEEL